jgi:HEAT repeat protein
MLSLWPIRRKEVVQALLEETKAHIQKLRWETEPWIPLRYWQTVGGLEEGGLTPLTTQPPQNTKDASRRHEAFNRLLARFPKVRTEEQEPFLPPSEPSSRVEIRVQRLSGHPLATSFLLALTSHEDSLLRLAATRSLLAGVGNLPDLQSLWSGSPDEIALMMAHCHRFKERRTIQERAIQALHTAQDQVRDAAALCLGHLGDRDGVGPLLSALSRSPSPSIIRSLGLLGDRRAVEPLRRMLREDHPPNRLDERIDIIQALGRIHDSGTSAVLFPEFHHPDPRVREAAATALIRLLGSMPQELKALCAYDYFMRVRKACLRRWP